MANQRKEKSKEQRSVAIDTLPLLSVTVDSMKGPVAVQARKLRACLAREQEMHAEQLEGIVTQHSRLLRRLSAYSRRLVRWRKQMGNPQLADIDRLNSEVRNLSRLVGCNLELASKVRVTGALPLQLNACRYGVKMRARSLFVVDHSFEVYLHCKDPAVAMKISAELNQIAGMAVQLIGSTSQTFEYDSLLRTVSDGTIKLLMDKPESAIVNGFSAWVLDREGKVLCASEAPVRMRRLEAEGVLTKIKGNRLPTRKEKMLAAKLWSLVCVAKEAPVTNALATTVAQIQGAKAAAELRKMGFEPGLLKTSSDCLGAAVFSLKGIQIP